MPHVIVEGVLTLGGLQRDHVPFTEREGGRVVKVDRFYLDAPGRAALLETLVVDGGHTQKFFIQLTTREDGVMVRLEPMTDPEKSPAVKRALATVARRIRAACGGRFGGTNIAEFLDEPGRRDGAS
ncbi:MAG TPA: hypothetical protein VFB49_08610 [Patescibacteria group bacterium]|nr:hypothetical protein [Patescibacteria group bacterium]